MFVVSAKSPEALADYLNKYLDFCLDFAFTFSCHFVIQVALAVNIIATDSRAQPARPLGCLEDRIQNPPTASVGNARRILFGFPGQGCQYQGMGRYLSDQYSGFRNTMIEAATKASKLTWYPVLPYLVEDHATGPLPIDNSEVAHVCITHINTLWLRG